MKSPSRRRGSPHRRLVRPDDVPEDLPSKMKPSLFIPDPRHLGRTKDRGLGPDKSPCDDKRQMSLLEARRLFREGVRRRTVSSRSINGLPKNVWAVDHEGWVYEANQSRGTYHGYRLDDRNDRVGKRLSREVRKRWEGAG